VIQKQQRAMTENSGKKKNALLELLTMKVIEAMFAKKPNTEVTQLNTSQRMRIIVVIAKGKLTSALEVTGENKEDATTK